MASIVMSSEVETSLIVPKDQKFLDYARNDKEGQGHCQIAF